MEKHLTAHARLRICAALLTLALTATLAQAASSAKPAPASSDGTAIPTDQTVYPKGVARQPAVASQCVSCHGPTGISQIPEWPNIAGQPYTYLLQQLQDFKSGARKHPMMQPVIAAVASTDLKTLAKHFSEQTPSIPKAADKAVTAKAVPASAATCVACHDSKAMPSNPSIAGQKATYLEEQLRAFRAGTRKNATMEPMAKGLSDQDIQGLAEHFSQLAPPAAAAK